MAKLNCFICMYDITRSEVKRYEYLGKVIIMETTRFEKYT